MYDYMKGVADSMWEFASLSFLVLIENTLIKAFLDYVVFEEKLSIK